MAVNPSLLSFGVEIIPKRYGFIANSRYSAFESYSRSFDRSVGPKKEKIIWKQKLNDIPEASQLNPERGNKPPFERFSISS